MDVVLAQVLPLKVYPAEIKVNTDTKIRKIIKIICEIVIIAPSNPEKIQTNSEKSKMAIPAITDKTPIVILTAFVIMHRNTSAGL